jgi:predicted RNase H-like nuclease (RuvC/YqgF family)
VAATLEDRVRKLEENDDALFDRLQQVHKGVSTVGQKLAEFRTETLARFDAIDNQFQAIDHRFEAIDHRFDGLDSRFDGLESKVDRLLGLEGKVDRILGHLGAN